VSRGLAAIDIVPIGSSEAALSVFFGHLGPAFRECGAAICMCASSGRLSARTSYGSDSDLIEWRSDDRFLLESGLDLALPVRLISAISRHRAKMHPNPSLAQYHKHHGPGLAYRPSASAFL